MSRKKLKIRYFLLTEIVMALGVMMLLFVCYFASTKSLDKMDRSFTNDARALQAVSNTIERIENMEHYKVDEVKRIFIDEYKKSCFAVSSKIVPCVKLNSDSAVLSLLKANGKAVIEVRIKCQK